MTFGKSVPAVAGLVLFCLFALPLAAEESSKHDWNDAEIDWKGSAESAAGRLGDSKPRGLSRLNKRACTAPSS